MSLRAQLRNPKTVCALTCTADSPPLSEPPQSSFFWTEPTCRAEQTIDRPGPQAPDFRSSRASQLLSGPLMVESHYVLCAPLEIPQIPGVLNALRAGFRRRRAETTRCRCEPSCFDCFLT